ncbi:ATP-binding protein [Kineococcus gynurae]|uniref:ATP-binding protein n=1 Tax=Kineococcus gynurae TaxID=452979 RepID=A0ABV5LV03_9ACTN
MGRVCDATPAAELSLPQEQGSARAARRFLSEASCPVHRARALDEAQLLVTELVTNAVRYGCPPLTVRVECDGGTGLRVWVGDGAEDLPVRREVPLEAEGGRGVALVDILSDRWGVLPRRDPFTGPGGKIVWFVLS